VPVRDRLTLDALLCEPQRPLLLDPCDLERGRWPFGADGIHDLENPRRPLPNL
jgi:hypothetical protein